MTSTAEPIHDGILRVTLPLPSRPGHVHTYLLEGEDGWTLVDTGLGLPGAKERWAEELAGLELRRVVITHMHPDHVGAAADVRELTGAEVLEGELDYRQCLLVWGSADWPNRIAEWFLTNGVPAAVANELLEVGFLYGAFIRYAEEPTPLQPGALVDGWEAVPMPGHADGQLCLFKDGVLIAADHLLTPISPAVGLYPESRPDPLGDYLASLERTIALDARLALGGHGAMIEDPSARARELIEHHRVRLARTAASLSDEPRSGYQVSLNLFGRELKPAARRFAVAETLSHLERLVVEGGAARADADGLVTYTAA
ncbi:MAG TPA: MBL fold metallo-hydrolase [Gaiellaceae bacterium]|nr:MBL fold metallo-hydrolase [Gaiellaceae bacterium]